MESQNRLWAYYLTAFQLLLGDPTAIGESELQLIPVISRILRSDNWVYLWQLHFPYSGKLIDHLLLLVPKLFSIG
jgi:hypothetical protein